MRRLGLAVALVSVVALVSGGAGLQSTTPRSVAAPAGHPVVHRLLVDQNGDPVAQQNVQLAWDGRASAGQERVLADATTDENGLVEIDWTPTAADVRAALTNGGWFNFTLLVGEPSHGGVFTIPAHWDGRRWTSDNPEIPGSAAARRLEAKPLRINMGDMALTEAQYRGQAAEAARRAPTYSEEMTLVANVPSGRDTKTTFTYGRKGDSTIEVKKSFGGDDWDSSGSAKVSNTEGAAVYGKVLGAKTRQLSVSVKYSKELRCVAGWTCYTLLQAREWTGDAKAPTITNWSCLHGSDYSVYKKSQFDGITRESGTNRTYDIGAEVFGVGVWSRSGYAETASLHVEFDAKKKVKDNRYCVGGSTDNWPSAKTLYVSSWRA